MYLNNETQMGIDNIGRGGERGDVVFVILAEVSAGTDGLLYQLYLIDIEQITYASSRGHMVGGYTTKKRTGDRSYLVNMFVYI